MTDPKQLIQRYCKKGDDHAFRIFYRQQAKRLWQFLVARGCASEHAYDLVADTFLKFIQAVCRDPRSPVAFLYRIAINQQIDHYRRDRASPVEFDTGQTELAQDLSSQTIDQYEYCRSLVRTLHSDEQNLLLMRYWIGLTHKEIAENLSLPEGTVRRQAASALQKLRQRWQENEEK